MGAGVSKPCPITGARSLANALRAWASTEIGGWLVVCTLALIAFGVAGAAVVLPRLKAAVTGAEATSAPAMTISSQAPVGDLADLTLAAEAVRDIDPADARLWNAALPFLNGPIRPAAPLIAPAADVEAYGRALDCLTAAVYYEAASETAQGQAAVAQVVLNRVRHPAYPRTVCGVVFQGSERTTGCQFSFACNGAMARTPSPTGWLHARTVATAALNGKVVAAVGTATHYHTDWVAPYWASRLSKIVQIGGHIFYRWNGAWGLPAAFSGAYSGFEPIVPKMAGLATIAVDEPVEIMVVSPPAPLALEQAPRLTPILSSPLPTETEPTAPAEVESISVEPVRAAPVVIGDVSIMADPLASPAAPPRRRPRIAAPSGW